MKTVSGSVISSKPISLSKAASILSAFVSAETGASHAVSTYLKRASTSFNELVQFHKELKSGRSERKSKKPRFDKAENRNPREDQEAIESGRIPDLEEEESFKPREISERVDLDDEARNSDSRKKKKKKRSDFGHDQIEAEDREIGGDAEIEVEKSKERKKRKKAEIEDGGLDLQELYNTKKKKKRKIEG